MIDGTNHSFTTDRYGQETGVFDLTFQWFTTAYCSSCYMMPSLSTGLCFRIGFNSFPTPDGDEQMKKVKACIGRVRYRQGICQVDCKVISC